MAEALVVPALLTGALLLAGIGWLTPRPAFAVSVTTALLVAAGVTAATMPITDGTRGTDTALVLLAGLLAVFAGSPVTATVFEIVDRPTATGRAGAPVQQAGAILRGGAWIGVLERAAVFGSIAAGWPEGVAIALAVKGLGRYPELRADTSTGAAERFIIGTFTSVLWAAGCALVVHLAR